MVRPRARYGTSSKNSAGPITVEHVEALAKAGLAVAPIRPEKSPTKAAGKWEDDEINDPLPF